MTIATFPSMTTTQRTLSALNTAALALLAGACAAVALIPDVLPGVGDRVMFGLVALLALAGAVVLVVDLVRARR